MYLTFLNLLAAASPATGDNREIGLWVIVAAVALALIVVCILLTIISNHKEK